NCQIIGQKTGKTLLTSSFLLLFIIGFIPIASAQKAVILNFDDDWKGQLTYAVPILEKYGFNATFFVTTECLTYQNTSVCNNAGGDSAMTWEDIRLLSELGYDIQSHGARHKDLTRLSAADLEYEVGHSKQSLLEHGYNPTIFGPAFGNGEGNSTVLNTISKYYDMARVGYAPLVYLNFTDRYSLPLLTDSEAERSYRDNSTKIFEDFVEAINNQAEYNTNTTINAIPIIVYHNVDYKNSSSNVPPQWLDATIDVKLFEQEMKYLHDNGVQVLTISDLGYNQTSNKLYIKK
ncbi:MAG: polysaccharide deacetylase family protein, partial [Thermoproteota archaeon]|nr:polysaccharide deacetylase family protein [Thermoproteota archaeon]